MFYTKLTLQDNGELITYLTDDIIYGNCPVCGKEIPIDLAEVLSEEDSTLCNTDVYCEDCAKKWLKKKYENGGLR